MRPHAKVRQSMTLHPGSHGLPLIKKPPCRTFFPLPLSRLAAAAGCVCWPAAAGPVHGVHVARRPWVVGHPVAPPCCCNMVGTSSCFWSGAHATRSALPAHSSPPLSACHQATPPGRQLHNHSSSSSCCPPCAGPVQPGAEHMAAARCACMQLYLTGCTCTGGHKSWWGRAGGGMGNAAGMG